MSTIACYKDYTLHIDPPPIPVPVCWWPFEVGVTIPWLDTAVPGLQLVAQLGSAGVYTAGVGKVGAQACRIDTTLPDSVNLTQPASTGLLNMSLNGFTMTGWVAPQFMTGTDYFGIRYRSYIGVQVDPFPVAFHDVYLQWFPNFGSTGTVEIGLVAGGVQQMFQLVTPLPLAVAWHFFVLIYDRIAGKIRFSFDNAALTESTDTYTVPIGWNTGAVVYQTNKGQPGTSVIGFDEVNYYNSILGAADINMIYNSGFGTTYP